MSTTPNQSSRRTPCPHPDICKVGSHLTDAARAECERRGKKHGVSTAAPSAPALDAPDFQPWGGSQAQKSFTTAVNDGTVIVRSGIHNESQYRGPLPDPSELVPRNNTEGENKLSPEACVNRGLGSDADVWIDPVGNDRFGNPQAIYRSFPGSNDRPLQGYSAAVCAMNDLREENGEPPLPLEVAAAHLQDMDSFTKDCVTARRESMSMTVKVWNDENGEEHAAWIPYGKVTNGEVIEGDLHDVSTAMAYYDIEDAESRVNFVREDMGRRKRDQIFDDPQAAYDEAEAHRRGLVGNFYRHIRHMETVLRNSAMEGEKPTDWYAKNVERAREYAKNKEA
mgnify:CR=1 FL=1